MIQSLLRPVRCVRLWTILAGLFLFITTGLLAQTGGAIRGKVTTSDGQPAEYATVVLSGGKATRVGKEGIYHFSNLEPGNYTVTVTFTGQEPRVQQVTVGAGETATADLTLAASELALNEVVIVGDKYTITSRKESNNVARLPLKYMENPQVYNVVDKELIREQMSLTLDESFRNVPGAAPAKTGAGIPSFFSRGFQTSDNLRNGMATYIRTTIDLATVERVETIKGPASTLFGASMISFGGLVNYVTKKPYDHLGGEVSYTQGSYDLSRLTADFNALVNADSSLLFRFNMAYQKENTFQDQGHGTTFMIAPSLSYQVNDRLMLRLDADLQNFSGTANTGWSIGGATNVNSYDQLKIDHARSLIDNSFVSKMYSNNIFLQAEYKLSEHWTSTTNYAWATGGYNNMYIFYMNWTSDTTVQRTVGVHTPDKLGRKHIQQNFTGDFRIGSMRNRLVVGLDFMDQYRDLKYTPVVLDIVDPRGAIAPVYVEQVDNAVAVSASPQNRSKQYTYGAYFSDVLNITDNLLVMASLRVDRFSGRGTKSNLTQLTAGDYSQSAVSPKFGVVYQVAPRQVSLFGNYMNGFKNVASYTQVDGTVSNFKPQQANQAEGGVKLDLFGGKLGATASYYDIQVKKTTRQELINGQPMMVQNGTQESKGVEIEIIANPFPGVNLLSGYGYNDNSFKNADATIVGKRALATPEHVGNIWLSYTLLRGSAKGLGAAGGVMYVSDVFADNTNRFTLPEYTVVDATLFYNTPKYRLSFKANNVAGKKYWVSDGFYVRPQKTANFLVSMTVRF